MSVREPSETCFHVFAEDIPEVVYINAYVWLNACDTEKKRVAKSTT